MLIMQKKYIDYIRDFFTKNINKKNSTIKTHDFLHRNINKKTLNNNFIKHHAGFTENDQNNFLNKDNLFDRRNFISSAAPDFQPKKAEGPLHVIVLNGRDLADGLSNHLANGLDSPVGGMTGVDPMLSPYGALGGLA